MFFASFVFNTAVAAVVFVLFGVGAIVSAFASSVGVLGAFIPVAVPWDRGRARRVLDDGRREPLLDQRCARHGQRPRGVDQDALYRQLLVYGAVIVAVVPPLAGLVLIVIGG